VDNLNYLCVNPDPYYLAISVAPVYSSYHLRNQQQFPMRPAQLLLSV